MALSQFSSTETLKDPEVTDEPVNSSPNLSPQDEKDFSTPSTPAEPINLESQTLSSPPYHVFTRSRKLLMVIIVSLAAIFSPLSSNIYFPALSDVAKELNVSMSLASLTITIYMIVQGLAPSLWGSFSDVVGRRVIFICTFAVYIISNIALAVSTNYGELMAFRGLQAAGSAATISIGAGVIGDITTSAERGSLIGIFGGVRMMGQGVGPVFGGILSQYLGFRSIFWFLTIASGISLISIMFFLPETLRSIAGNGTVPLKGIHKPIVYSIYGQKNAQKDSTPSGKKVKITFKTVLAPLTFLAEKDVFITLLFGSMVYTVWSMVTSSTSALFEEKYGLNSLEVGLTFLGNGFGCMTGSYTIGYLMDFNHKRTEHEYCQQHSLPIDTRINSKSYPDFPIEYARMRNTWWITAIFIVCVAVYGVSLRTHLAVPIILQFIIAYGSTAIFTINSALVIDLYPGASASATAVNNLMRCLMGAAGVAAVQPIIDALTAEFAFLMLAGITIAMVPLLIVEMKWGYGWRLERQERIRKENTV
ncbi:Major facilitator superfamily domain general substrate transporter [Penicillium cf. griseofulvum]|uniref:Citrate exporter 1 n=1 Tax=Penicillium cf. griseofulvum TaxID=2972120 RepID=A0A9W9JNQ7_9EURO|nr:Major facilitator superfamily domain general substrate transporter [Penicillium cf. griseofulvum]KAJ5442152.1 Major facilitator superfamily domain general substrate transporter [Penicillium cf. griseofulvum]KAJ5450875.1 Major facilitator superfamily domain general substrate transporter [Penicillium cf. griseofulvum]